MPPYTTMPPRPHRRPYQPDEDGTYAQFMKHLKIKEVLEDNFIEQVKTAITDLSEVVLARCKDADDTVSVRVSIKYLQKPLHIKQQQLEETVDDENLNKVLKTLNEALHQHLAKKKKLVKELPKKMKQLEKEQEDAVATGSVGLETAKTSKKHKRSVSESLDTSSANESPESKKRRAAVADESEQTPASNVAGQTKSKKQKQRHSSNNIEQEINTSQLDSSIEKQSKTKTPKNKNKSVIGQISNDNTDVDASNSSKKKKKRQL